MGKSDRAEGGVWSQGEGTFDVSRISLFTLVSGRRVEFGRRKRPLCPPCIVAHGGLARRIKAGGLRGGSYYRVEAIFTAPSHIKAFYSG